MFENKMKDFGNKLKSIIGEVSNTMPGIPKLVNEIFFSNFIWILESFTFQLFSSYAS